MSAVVGSRIRRLLSGSSLYVCIGLACALFAGPILWLVMTSFKSEGEVYTDRPTLFPRDFTVEPYGYLFAREHYLTYAYNSTVITVFATVLTVVVAILAAYAFSRYRFRGNIALFLGVLMARMVPPISFVVPLYWIVRSVGLIDTKLVLVILYTVLHIPMAIWILRIFFDQVPKELEDSGRIDGCSNLGLMWRIVIPLSIPSIAIVTILTFVNCWNEYLYALTFTQTPQARTLPVELANLLRPEHGTNWGQLAALTAATLIPIFVVAGYIQRYLVSGILSGSVKG